MTVSQLATEQCHRSRSLAYIIAEVVILQNNQTFKLIFAIFRDKSPKFFNAPTAKFVNLILTCQGLGSRQMILILEIMRLISVNMRCTISVFKVGEKETYSRIDVTVFSRCLVAYSEFYLI